MAGESAGKHHSLKVPLRIGSGPQQSETVAKSKSKRALYKTISRRSLLNYVVKTIDV